MIIIIIIIIILTGILKLMSGMLTEKMYSHLTRENLLSSEQKGCRKRNRGTDIKRL